MRVQTVAGLLRYHQSLLRERHTHTYSHTENKFFMQRFGETPGLDKHRHADNSKMPPHEFCSRLSLLDIFMKKKEKEAISLWQASFLKDKNEGCEVGAKQRRGGNGGWI